MGVTEVNVSAIWSQKSQIFRKNENIARRSCRRSKLRADSESTGNFASRELLLVRIYAGNRFGEIVEKHAIEVLILVPQQNFEGL